MRVGLNAHFWRHQSTGSGQYLNLLVEGLLSLGSGDEFVLFSASRDAQEERGTLAGLSMRGVPYRFGGLNENLGKVWFEQLGVPRECCSAGVEVVHYPYFAAPLRCEVPVVVTVHDLIPLILPPYRGGVLARIYTRLVSIATGRAAHVITDSECSRRDVVNLLNVPEDRITVIYLAASERFRPLDDGAELEAKKRHYGLDGPFVLYLGGIDYRKNVPRLLRAFAEVLRRGLSRPDFPPGLKLVVVGDVPDPSPLFPDVRRQVTTLGLEGHVKFVGRVPDDDARFLYCAAELFVFPSLYEGFGLPPLEAMACRTPVICSNRSSLPEVVGDAALTVDPEDVAALAEAIERVLVEDHLKRELGERGLRRAAQFTWKKTAIATLDVYRQALERRRCGC